jgi:hypothetical protein
MQQLFNSHPCGFLQVIDGVFYNNPASRTEINFTFHIIPSFRKPPGIIGGNSVDIGFFATVRLVWNPLP